MSSKETKSKKQSSKDNSSNKKKVRRAAAKVDKNKLLIEKFTIENKDLEDKLLRSKAEFENFRKRKEKEIIDIVVAKEQVERVFEKMYLAGNLDTPGMGIMYITNLDKAATYIPPEVLTKFSSPE